MNEETTPPRESGDAADAADAYGSTTRNAATGTVVADETLESSVREPFGPDRKVARPGRGRSVLAWAGVAAWGAFALLRLVGADRSPALGAFAAPLLAVTAYVAAAAVVPVVLALAVRRWAAAASAAVIAVALLLTLVPRMVGGGPPAPANGPTLRVLTANLYFGRADPRELVELVRRTRPDVLSLQELPPEAVPGYERSGLTRHLPHKVVHAQTGAAGSGLYSRYPLWELPSLGETSMRTPQAQLTLPGGRRVQVTAVHPVPPISSRWYELWKHDIDLLPAARAAFPSPPDRPASAAGPRPSGAPVRILAGDFNATLDHATFRRLLGRGYADAADRAGAGLVPTWGEGRSAPPISLDHILADRRCDVTAYGVHDLSGSDHRAVFAEIRLP